MVGHLGAAQSISPIRTARIAVFLVPDEMDAHPGLAPGSSVLQTDGSTTLPCARFGKWGGRRVLPPLSDLHRIECWLLHHGLHLKAILRPELPRHGLLYERSALLTSATEESKMALPRGLAPRTSAFAGRHAWLLHFGSEKMVRHAGAAPALTIWDALRGSAA